MPHPRTLRKAREQIKYMVIDEVSPRKIKNYLHRFCLWWVKTSSVWQYGDILRWFIETCWEINLAAYAAGLLKRHLNELEKAIVAWVLVHHNALTVAFL